MPFLVSRGMVRREKRQKGLEKLCLLRPIPKSQARRGEGRIPDLFWPYHPFLSQMTFFVRNVVLFWAFFCAGNEKKMSQKRTRVVFPPALRTNLGFGRRLFPHISRAFDQKNSPLRSRRRSFYTLAVVFPSLLFHFFDLLSLSFQLLLHPPHSVLLPFPLLHLRGKRRNHQLFKNVFFCKLTTDCPTYPDFAIQRCNKMLFKRLSNLLYVPLQSTTRKREESDFPTFFPSSLSLPASADLSFFALFPLFRSFFLFLLRGGGKSQRRSLNLPNALLFSLIYHVQTQMPPTWVPFRGRETGSILWTPPHESNFLRANLDQAMYTRGRAKVALRKYFRAFPISSIEKAGKWCVCVAACEIGNANRGRETTSYVVGWAEEEQEAAEKI